MGTRITLPKIQLNAYCELQDPAMLYQSSVVRLHCCNLQVEAQKTQNHET